MLGNNFDDEYEEQKVDVFVDVRSANTVGMLL